MTDCLYRTFFGLGLLIALYFESALTVYALVGLLFVEGITRYSVPRTLGVLGGLVGIPALAYRPEACNPNFRFNFDGELAWRMMMGVVLLTTYSFYEYLWFFPWFIGFVVFGAGVSGICPVLMALRWLGFK